METLKPASLEMRNKLLEELGKLNRQIREFRQEIGVYEKSENSDKGLIATFSSYSERNSFTGFPVAKNEDGFSKGEIAGAMKVFDVFSTRYLEHSEGNKKTWEFKLKQAETRKMAILEELHALGVPTPLESSTPSVDINDAEIQGSKKEPSSDTGKLGALQQQIEQLTKQAESLTKRIAYDKKFPTPASISVPEDGTTLPSIEDYPRILDIHVAIEQAEADGKYIYALDTKAENNKRIKYLNHLLENSPETKQIVKANESAGAHRMSVSFSPEQELFIRQLQDVPEFARFETAFSTTVRKEPEQKGVIQYTDYDGSDMSNLRYQLDVLLYAEGFFENRSENLPKWLVEKKVELERLFPNYGKNTEK